MGRHLNSILALLILVIVTAICSSYFYKKGQADTWVLAQQLVPLEKGEVYLCVERTGAKGVGYLTVETLSKATQDKSINQRELKFRINLALNGSNLQEYNDKYRAGKKGF